MGSAGVQTFLPCERRNARKRGNAEEETRTRQARQARQGPGRETGQTLFFPHTRIPTPTPTPTPTAPATPSSPPPPPPRTETPQFVALTGAQLGANSPPRRVPVSPLPPPTTDQHTIHSPASSQSSSQVKLAGSSAKGSYKAYHFQHP